MTRHFGRTILILAGLTLTLAGCEETYTYKGNPICGGEGQPCCETTNKCNSNLVCAESDSSDEKTCQPCGDKDQACCENDTKCTAPNTECNNNKCIDKTGKDECGDKDQPCCNGENGSKICNSNLVCVDSKNDGKKTCQPCGGKDQLCCNGENGSKTCNSSDETELTCHNNICKPKCTDNSDCQNTEVTELCYLPEPSSDKICIPCNEINSESLTGDDFCRCNNNETKCSKENKDGLCCNKECITDADTWNNNNCGCTQPGTTPEHTCANGECNSIQTHDAFNHCVLTSCDSATSNSACTTDAGTSGFCCNNNCVNDISESDINKYGSQCECYTGCDNGNVCTSTGTCVECIDDNNCSQKSMVCKTSGDGAKNICVPCFIDKDETIGCPDKHTCSVDQNPKNNKCEPNKPSEGCQTDSDCRAPKPVCKKNENDKKGTCVECTEIGHCTGTKTCIDSKCVEKPAECSAEKLKELFKPENLPTKPININISLDNLLLLTKTNTPKPKENASCLIICGDIKYDDDVKKIFKSDSLQTVIGINAVDDLEYLLSRHDSSEKPVPPKLMIDADLSEPLFSDNKIKLMNNLNIVISPYKASKSMHGIIANNLDGATIQNVSIHAAIDQSNCVDDDTGIFVGTLNNGKFINNSFDGKFSISCNKSDINNIGGFIGTASNLTNFSNNQFKGNFTINMTNGTLNNIGVLAGHIIVDNVSTLDKNTAILDLFSVTQQPSSSTTNTTASIGGLFGLIKYNQSTVIKNHHFSATEFTIISSRNTNTGGLIGEIDKASNRDKLEIENYSNYINKFSLSLSELGKTNNILIGNINQKKVNFSNTQSVIMNATTNNNTTGDNNNNCHMQFATGINDISYTNSVSFVHYSDNQCDDDNNCNELETTYHPNANNKLVECSTGDDNACDVAKTFSSSKTEWKAYTCNVDGTTYQIPLFSPIEGVCKTPIKTCTP